MRVTPTTVRKQWLTPSPPPGRQFGPRSRRQPGSGGLPATEMAMGLHPVPFVRGREHGGLHARSASAYMQIQGVAVAVTILQTPVDTQPTRSGAGGSNLQSLGVTSTFCPISASFWWRLIRSMEATGRARNRVIRLWSWRKARLKAWACSSGVPWTAAGSGMPQ